MNSVAKAIESRMSVRAFTKEAVSKEIILRLLNLSVRAPCRMSLKRSDDHAWITFLSK